MLEDEPRPVPSNTNSAVGYGKQYGLILPILKNVCTDAYNEVEKKLKDLQKLYPANI